MGRRSLLRVGRALLMVLLGTVLWGCGESNVVPDDGNGNGGGGQAPLPDPVVVTRLVTGFVGDQTTGAGIAGATVEVGALRAVTGAAGQFTLPSVPRQNTTATVTAAGYQSLQVPLGANQDQLNVRLVPQGAGDVQNPPGPVNP